MVVQIAAALCDPCPCGNLVLANLARGQRAGMPPDHGQRGEGHLGSSRAALTIDVLRLFPLSRCDYINIRTYYYGVLVGFRGNLHGARSIAN